MRAVFAYHHDERDGGSFVDYVGVDPSCRKQGLATLLINSLPPPVVLCVRPFTSAQKAYVAMGFVHDATREAGVGGIFMVLHSTKHPSATLRGEAWGNLSDDHRVTLVETVRLQQHTSKNGAHCILATNDDRMRYIVLF